ncbi:MAG TPA: hypothetical protein VGZ02_01590 [Candidatus Baltobacteraceae bacterium]|nr:hypothetical protein [Candidatus Baltobacteraceae bacterium]
MNYTLIALYSQVASSILFLGVMIWIWIRFIQPAVLTAQNNQNAQLAEAERRRDDAKRLLDGLQGEIENAKRDALAIKERVTAQGAAERDAILRDAREGGERTVRNAQGELDRSRAAAREQLRDELLDRALEAAHAKAAQRVDESMNSRLVTEFADTLEHGGRN